jgi:chromosome segregation ATPase
LLKTSGPFCRVRTRPPGQRAKQTELRANLGAGAPKNRLRSQAEAIQRELAVSEERARQYQAQREEILVDLLPLTENLTAQKLQLAEVEAALQAITQELKQAEENQGAAQQRLEAYQARRQSFGAPGCRRKAGSPTNHCLTERQARLNQFEERRATLLAERETYEAEISV